MSKKPVMLMILDGFGITDKTEGNAVAAANKPNYENIFNKYPHIQLAASGLEVGLPEGQMGNSEVGHLNIGAGRVVYQELTRITKAIKDGDFFENEAFQEAIDNTLQNDTSLHLLGLLSDGGVHSHIDHVKALLKLAKDKGVKNVFVHAFMDGRDTSPSSGKQYVEELQKYIDDIGNGKIASVVGRYYAMDRDNRWDRVQLAYNALVLGKGEAADSAESAVENSYKNDKTDEFIRPTVIMENGEPVSIIKDGDSVIFFNFRPDRARELTRAINDSSFDGFQREKLNLKFITMTQYDKTIENVRAAYPPQSYDNTLGEWVSKLGKKQLRIAETEKYAHVTFFFNGGVEAPNKGEDRVLIPSPKVATYDLKPEMSAYEVTEQVLQKLDSDEYDMVILNYANPDMVGHTGIFDAAKKAIEVVDECLGKVVDKILEKDGVLFVTADHGNAEQMVDYCTKKPMTAHTCDPVPFIYVANNPKQMMENGTLADIAPTMLKAMELEIPAEMTGKSLI